MVVGQVPVKRVHLVARNQIDVALDEFDGEKMTAHVEVHATVGKPRGVFDVHGRHGPNDVALRTRGFDGPG